MQKWVKNEPSVDSGTWKGEDLGKPTAYSGLVVGLKKRFWYEDGITQQVGRWIMHEYSLDCHRLNTVTSYLRKNRVE